MKIGTAITLTDVEQNICKTIAEARYRSNRAAGVADLKRGDQSNIATDTEGFAAELAFCKLFNLYPDFTISPRGAANDVGDATLRCGLSVDVKATVYKSGHLITPPWKDESALDLYALMVGKLPTYTFKGFMRRDVLQQEDRLGDLGYGPTYKASQEDLCELPETCNTTTTWCRKQQEPTRPQLIGMISALRTAIEYAQANPAFYEFARTEHKATAFETKPEDLVDNNFDMSWREDRDA